MKGKNIYNKNYLLANVLYKNILKIYLKICI